MPEFMEGARGSGQMPEEMMERRTPKRKKRRRRKKKKMTRLQELTALAQQQRR